MVEMANHEECLKDKIKYASNFKIVKVEALSDGIDNAIEVVQSYMDAESGDV